MMPDKMPKRFALAIETAVGGGSLALSETGKEVDSWNGDGSVSKVEEVIKQISLLLKSNNVIPGEINSINVSRGPGSYTGARIGIATALGLKKAWNCELNGISVFDAMAFNGADSADDFESNILIAAILVGTKQIAFQIYSREAGTGICTRHPPTLTGINEFLSFISSCVSDTHIFTHRDLSALISAELSRLSQTRVKTADNFSVLINRYCFFNNNQVIKKLEHYNPASDNVKAIYLSNDTYNLLNNNR